MTTCCERRTAARSHFAARDRVVKERWRATRVGSSFFDSALRAESRTTLDAPVSCPRYVGAFGSYAKRSGVSTVMLHDDDAFMSVVAPSPWRASCPCWRGTPGILGRQLPVLALPSRALARALRRGEARSVGRTRPLRSRRSVLLLSGADLGEGHGCQDPDLTR